MLSLAGLTRHLCFANSFANGLADAGPKAGVGGGVDTSGAGMVSICSVLPAELVLAAAGATAMQPGSPNLTHMVGEGFDSFRFLLCGLRVGVTLRTGQRGGVGQDHLGR